MPDRGTTTVGRRTRVFTVLVAVVCVVVAGIAVKITDNLDSGEVIRHVRVGESAPFNSGTISVTKVLAGTVMTDDSSEDPLTTGGMFLALRIRIEAPNQQIRVGGPNGPELRSSDRLFRAFSNTAIVVKAGNVGTGDMIFEVDPRHLDDLYVDLEDDEIFHVTPAVVRVHLGITDKNAAQWYASAKGRTLHAAEPQEKAIP